MFWQKKRELTLVEQTTEAVDRLSAEVGGLHLERNYALSTFRETANWLAQINEELGQKSALCGTLMTQMKTVQESISKQVEDNDKVRGKILDIIGE